MSSQKVIQEKALRALKKAVKGVVARHKKTGRPIAVWENGKVVLKKV